MPWQLDPESETSRAAGEQIYVADLPRLGRVRGTRLAMTYASAPLPPSRGRNRTLAPCRALIAREAQKYGSASVEATSLGFDRRTRDGSYEGPVGVRILYPDPGGYQVRQAAVVCKVDQRGKVLDAYVPGSGAAEFAALKG